MAIAWGSSQKMADPRAAQVLSRMSTERRQLFEQSVDTAYLAAQIAEVMGYKADPLELVTAALVRHAVMRNKICAACTEILIDGRQRLHNDILVFRRVQHVIDILGLEPVGQPVPVQYGRGPAS